MRKTATGSPTGVGSESADNHVSDQASGADEDAVDQDGTAAASPDGDGEGHEADAALGFAQADQDSGTYGDPTEGDYAAGERATFRRAPGMVPPPDHLDDEAGGSARDWGNRGAFGGSSRSLTTTTDTETGGFPAIGGVPQVSEPGQGAMVTMPEAFRVRSVESATASAAIGSARVQEAVRATRMPSGPRGPRRARLSVKRLDPWSVMKFSFAVSLVLFIVVIVATSVLYLALDTMGVFASVNNTLADLVESGGADGEGFRVTASGVIGTAAVLGAVNVVLFTALATLGAFVYNVCADLVGGVEVTLAERE